MKATVQFSTGRYLSLKNVKVFQVNLLIFHNVLILESRDRGGFVCGLNIKFISHNLFLLPVWFEFSFLGCSKENNIFKIFSSKENACRVLFTSVQSVQSGSEGSASVGRFWSYRISPDLDPEPDSNPVGWFSQCLYCSVQSSCILIRHTHAHHGHISNPQLHFCHKSWLNRSNIVIC